MFDLFHIKADVPIDRRDAVPVGTAAAVVLAALSRFSAKSSELSSP